MVLAIVREAGPLGTTFMQAAAAGTAITADIGSRTERDAIAAMQVMAVDPIHRVVVPRVVGASIAAGLMTGIVIMGGLAGGFLYSVFLKGSNAGAYMDGFSTLAQMADLGLRSEEHTSELQSLMRISYAVFCLQKKTNTR